MTSEKLHSKADIAQVLAWQARENATLRDLAWRLYATMLKEGGCNDTWCHECLGHEEAAEDGCDKRDLLLATRAAIAAEKEGS